MSKPLEHWMVNADLLASEFDQILRLSDLFPGLGAGGPLPDDITLLAPLDGNINDLKGHPATFTRAGSALYLDADGIWQIAGNNTPRFALVNNVIGYLDEPARTNICQNYNANPDAALTNLVLGGDAAATLTRVEDIERLEAAGLQNVCSDGNAIQVNNLGGSTNAILTVVGTVASGTKHYCSAFVRGIGTVQVGMGGSGPNTTLVTDFVRVINQIIAAPDATFSLTVLPGSACNMVLNQAEMAEDATTPIITAGASAQRVEDRLSWAGSNIFSQASCAYGVVIVPSFTQGDIARNRAHTYLKPIDDSSSSAASALGIYVKDNSFVSTQYSYDNNAFCGILSAIVAGQEFVLVGRHDNTGTPQRDFGIKRLGTWSWSADCTYAGAYETDDNLWLGPFFKGMQHHYRNLVMWKRALSRSELEDAFADFANS